MNSTKTTRRALLAALAASTAAAASSAAPEAAENPELVQLADRIEPTLTVHLDAVAKVGSIMAEWQPKAPALPMCERWNEPSIIRFSSGSRRYTDIGGKPIPIPRGKNGDWTQVVDLGTAEVFEASAAAHFAEAERRSHFKTQRGMKGELRAAESDSAKVEPARQYWAEFDRIVARSGIQDAEEAVKSTREELHALISEIMAFEERSIVGLVIKAQALAAWNEVDKFYVMLNLSAPEWSKQISETIQRRVAA